MATKPIAFRETEEFKRGQTGEKIVAEALKLKGWYVIPIYDYSGEDGNKAPKMHGLSDGVILPDLDVCHNGCRRWAEVKAKGAATLYRKTQQLEHGIQYRHWLDYKRVQKISGCEVWLFIYEENTGDILCSHIDKLSPRIYTGGKMGRGGMVFFTRDSFRRFTNINDLPFGRPEAHRA